ncbi:MAG: hypothetical protein R3F59_30640, partial [Myxococcota bacterium]
MLVWWPLFGLAQAQGFTDGTLYYASQQGELYAVTEDPLPTATRFGDVGAYVAGQLAFSRDGATMYVPLPNDHTVLAVTPDGTVTPYATGLVRPLGLLVTDDGHLLVTNWDDGEVLDITGGGDVSSVAPLVTGLGWARHLLQLADGRVLVSDQQTGNLHDIAYPRGGPVGAPFATGVLGVLAIAQTPDGRIFAGGQWDVWDVTAGGAAATPFTHGQELIGLAVAPDGRLIAGTYLGTVLFDVTGGGDLSSASPWLTGLPVGDTALAFGPLPPGPTDTAVDTGA